MKHPSVCLVFGLFITVVPSTFGQATIPDHKNQVVSPGIAFMPDQGQIAYTDHTGVPGMEYASTGNPLQLFLRKGPKLSFVSRVVHADTSIQDTTFRVDMDFIGEGTTGTTEAQPLLETTWYHNYYLPQCPAGATGVHGYQYLVYEDVYPNVDVHVLSNAWGYKFYFVVWPGGDPSGITMQFAGHDALDVDVTGALKILLEDHWVRLPQAIAYQLDGNTTVGVPWSVEYNEVLPDLKVKLEFGEYDHTKPLVFDISENSAMGGEPVLPSPEWGTYYNGVGAYVLNAARSTDGGMVTCGASATQDFPLTNGATMPPNGGQDAFYSHFTDQYHMLYTTYIGGESGDKALGVAERNGKVVVTGTTKNAEGIIFAGPTGSFIDETEGIDPDHNWGYASGTCWIALFSASGIQVWMTLFGPRYALEPANVDFDASGNMYLAGTVTWAAQVEPLPVEPTTGATFNSLPICGGGYSQSQMGFVDWEPGPPHWSDGFLAKFNNQAQLERSTLFGGNSWFDHITDMEVDRSDGTAFIVGTTQSPQGTNAPCTHPAFDEPGFPWCPGVVANPYFLSNTSPGAHSDGVMTGYLAEIKSTGELQYCTSLACADQDDEAYAVTYADGRVTVVGAHSCESYSTGCGNPAFGLPQCNADYDFTWPLVPNNNVQHFYIQQIKPATHQLVWSSTLGDAEPSDVSADATGKVYVTGSGNATSDLPMMDNADYYSSTLPGTGEATYVLGFEEGGQFWGTQYGNHLTAFAVASRTLDRIYVAGERGDFGFVPYNCPWTTDPWCVDNAAISGICYSQLKVTLPIGQEELPTTSSAGLSVYPNPTNGQVVLTGFAQTTGLGTITLTDPLGRVITRNTLNVVAGKATLILPPVANGVYHLLVGSLGGTQRPIAILVQP